MSEEPRKRRKIEDEKSTPSTLEYELQLRKSSSGSVIKFYQDLVRFVCEEDKSALVDTFLGIVAAQARISPWEKHDIIFARASEFMDTRSFFQMTSVSRRCCYASKHSWRLNLFLNNYSPETSRGYIQSTKILKIRSLNVSSKDATKQVAGVIESKKRCVYTGDGYVEDLTLMPLSGAIICWMAQCIFPAAKNLTLSNFLQVSAVELAPNVRHFTLICNVGRDMVLDCVDVSTITILLKQQHNSNTYVSSRVKLLTGPKIKSWSRLEQITIEVVENETFATLDDHAAVISAQVENGIYANSCSKGQDKARCSFRLQTLIAWLVGRFAYCAREEIFMRRVCNTRKSMS